MFNYPNLIDWAYTTGLFNNWKIVICGNDSWLGLYLMYGGCYDSRKSFNELKISWKILGWLKERSLLSGRMEMSLID